MSKSECFWTKFKSPKFFIQLVIISICLGVSIYQLWECFRKLITPPLYTHQRIIINETMRYPSITLCRWPAYKVEYLKKYGLLSQTIQYSSIWKTFNFQNYTLSEFFEEATFNITEYLAIYGLDGLRSNLDVQSTFTLTMGRCFTFTPKEQSSMWGSTSGYFFYMRHDGEDYNNSLYSTNDIGFYMYVHDPKRIFTDKLMNTIHFMENIFVGLGDALQYKLTVTSLKKLSVKNRLCNDDAEYNAAKCQNDCVTKLITEDIECSTPWLPNKNLPECNTVSQIQHAIDYSSPNSLFLETYLEKCECLKSCSTTMFFPYLQGEKRTSYRYDSSLSMYYSTGLVTFLQEGFSYDGNDFLADLGGSLGFLLGLSVLGVIAWVENLILTFAIHAKQKKLKKNRENSETSSSALECETSTSKIEFDDNWKNANKVDEKTLELWNRKMMLNGNN